MTRNTPEQRALDRYYAAKTQEEANEAWDALAALHGRPKRVGDAPFAEPASDAFCPKCFAEDVAGAVLEAFTKECPEVQMSYDAWMMLGVVIEVEIKGRLGVLEPDADDSPEPVTVQ